MSNDARTFGEWLQDSRKASRASLRTVAAVVGISPSYLSEIENDRRVPAEDVLQRICDAVSLDFDEAMARACRLGESTERYLKRHPEAVALIRRIAVMDLTETQLKALIEIIEEKF